MSNGIGQRPDGSTSDDSNDFSPMAATGTRGGFAIEDQGNRKFRCILVEDEDVNNTSEIHEIPAQPLTPVAELTQCPKPLQEHSKEEVLKLLKESMFTVLSHKQKAVAAVVEQASMPQRPVIRKSPSAPLANCKSRPREISRQRSAFAAVNLPEEREYSDDEEEDLIQDLKFASGNLGCRVLKGLAKEVKRVEAETSADFSEDDVPVARQLPSLDITSGSTLSPGSHLGLPSSAARMAMPLIPWEELKKLHELGRGQFATVWLCQWRHVNVAMKEWHGFSNDESLINAVKEAETLAALRHPCVLSFYGMVTDCPSPAHIMECMVHGSLKAQLVHMRKEGFDSPGLKAAIALQAARGMDYLHSRDIIHFDLKSANLLCDLRHLDSPVVKIGDVGLSKEKLQSFVSGNMRGTLPWMAPELFPTPGNIGGSVLDSVDEMVDVYSFGVVLWEIWTLGMDPFPDMDTTELLFGIMGNTLKLEIPLDCDNDWAGLIEHCMEKEAHLRPQFEHIATTLEVLTMKFAKQTEAPQSSPFCDLTSYPQGSLLAIDSRFVSGTGTEYFSTRGSFDEPLV